MQSWPIFMPGQSVIGRFATFDSSRVMCPEKPGSMKPAVECVSRPRRPSDDLPSRRPARSSARVTSSNVEPSTNSPGCSTKGSSPSFSTSEVSSSCCSCGSMWVYLLLSKTRKKRSSRTSMLDGWTMVGSNGSTPRRPESSSLRRSRSLSSTWAAYPVCSGGPHVLRVRRVGREELLEPFHVPTASRFAEAFLKQCRARDDTTQRLGGEVHPGGCDDDGLRDRVVGDAEEVRVRLPQHQAADRGVDSDGDVREHLPHRTLPFADRPV